MTVLKFARHDLIATSGYPTARYQKYFYKGILIRKNERNGLIKGFSKLNLLNW